MDWKSKMTFDPRKVKRGEWVVVKSKQRYSLELEEDFGRKSTIQRFDQKVPIKDFREDLEVYLGPDENGGNWYVYDDMVRYATKEEVETFKKAFKAWQRRGWEDEDEDD
jgi:hypothetical protein